MQMLCTVTHAAVEYPRPRLWLRYCLFSSAVTGSRLILLRPGSCSSATSPTGIKLSLCMTVAQLLHPETDSGPKRHGEEVSCRSGLLRRSAVVLCISYVWVKFTGSTDQLDNSEKPRGISAAIQRTHMYFIYIEREFCFCFISNSLASSSLTVACFEHYCSFFCTKIFHNTQKILLHWSTSSSSEVLAVCGVNNTVWRALKVTVGPANDKRNIHESQFHISTQHFMNVHKQLYTVRTLEDMSYMSGIQNLFHHTPQPPRGGIRLRSRRVYTLQ